MNTRAKTFDRNVLSKTLGDGLERGDIHLFAGCLLPSPDPTDTKVTVRVVNEKRLLGRRGAVSQAVRANEPRFNFSFRRFHTVVTIRFESNVVVYCAAKIRSKTTSVYEHYMQPTSAQDEAKRAAAAQAIERFLKDGMTIGLGSGTTSRWFVRILGERVAKGLRVTGVPSSKSTGQLAQEVGVPLADLNDVGQLDLTIDGADEIDGKGRMIKGGGANLLWEKIVACASNRMVCIVDESKLVEIPRPISASGRSRSRLPGEAPSGICESCSRDCGLGDPEIEMRGGFEKPLITDSGHYLLDCHLEKIPDPESLGRKIEPDSRSRGAWAFYRDSNRRRGRACQRRD